MNQNTAQEKRDRTRRIASTGAKKIALTAIMAATLTAGKLVFASLPNIEVVTLLCAVYGCVFGIWGVLSTFIFVGTEVLIWGFAPWVITYLVHWPLVAVTFLALGNAAVKNRWLATGIALLLTVAFGVFSSLVDVGLLSGTFQNFWARFAVYYARGAVFYAIQLACNAILFPLAFVQLATALKRMNTQIGAGQARNTTIR